MLNRTLSSEQHLGQVFAGAPGATSRTDSNWSVTREIVRPAPSVHMPSVNHALVKMKSVKMESQERNLSNQPKGDKTTGPAGSTNSPQTDWSKTELGAIESWPASLQNAFELSLNASNPIAIYWGADAVLLYNQAWHAMAGGQDLRSLGQKAATATPELWRVLGPQIQIVRETRAGDSYKDKLLPMQGARYSEERYFSYSLNPIKAADGTVEGIFSIAEETTASVVQARRNALLRKLESDTTLSKSPEQACADAAYAIATDPADVPFALVYLVDWELQRAVLFGSTGISLNSPLAPPMVETFTDRILSSGWHIAEVATTGVAHRISDLSERLDIDFESSWPQVPKEALVLPIFENPGHRVAAVFVAGVNPLRTLDDGDFDFYHSVRSRIADAIEAARGNQEEQRRSEKLEQQLRHSQKMEEAGLLACGAAHDLNNLLTMIYGHSGMLSEQLGNDPMLADVAIINSACERAIGLTKHLMEFSRQGPEVRRLNLNRVISDFEPLLRGLLGHNVELVTLLSPSLDWVLADPRQLERVMMNLVVNARDAMPNGGRLLIETSHGELDDVHGDSLEGMIPDSSVLLKITDTGTGMDKAVLRRLFDPFFTTKAPGKGVGLGLATVYDILKQNGGSIWVESEPGKGTTFTLSLPRMANNDASE